VLKEERLLSGELPSLQPGMSDTPCIGRISLPSTVSG
jgi:hypothetical protein